MSNPVPTLAFQMFCPASACVQPVTFCPPEITVFAEPCQITVWPLVPESAAVKVSGELNVYVPPASWTTTSPVIVGAIVRTDVWAWAREHGWADEHAVPEPVGEA